MLNSYFFKLYGCYYHLCSNIWKHVQEFGMQPRYLVDEEFALCARMLAALAFVPPNDVIFSFDLLSDHCRNNFDQDLDDLLDYFENNYIGRFRHNAPRRRPTFGIHLWNMFHRTDNELPRTNNAVEGWHRSFQTMISECHPTIWKFIKSLKKEEGIIRATVLQNQGGHEPPRQRRRYADNNARILRIVDDYANRDRIYYLRSIAHNINF